MRAAARQPRLRGVEIGLRLRQAGARIVEVTVPDAAPLAELSRAVVYSEATALHAPQLRAEAGRYTSQVRLRASTGLAIPGTVYLEALRLRLPLGTSPLHSRLPSIRCRTSPRP